MPVQLQSYSVTLWKREVQVFVARQADLGLRSRIFTDQDVWVYGGFSALHALAAVFDGIALHGGVALLERHADTDADMLVFQGVLTPFNFPDYRMLRQQLRRRQPGRKVTWETRPEGPEDWKDGHWVHDDQVTIRANGHGTLVAGSPIGLRYCALCTLRLTESQGDHTHIFWCNTSKSAELSIAKSESPGT